VAGERQDAGGQAVPRDSGRPVQERLRCGLHLADADHRWRQALHHLRLQGGVQRRDHPAHLHRWQDPDHRQAQLRRRQPVDHRAPVCRSVEDRRRRGDHPVLSRHSRPGATAHHRRPLQDGLPQPEHRPGSHVHRGRSQDRQALCAPDRPRRGWLDRHGRVERARLPGSRSAHRRTRRGHSQPGERD